MNGDVQRTGTDPSTEHMKVTFSWSEVKVKVALADALIAGGRDRMMVSGSPTTVQVWLAGVGSTVPFSRRSNAIARTSSVCRPGSRPTSSRTPSQPLNSSPSSEHSNSSTSRSLWNPKIVSGPETSPGWTAMNVSGVCAPGGGRIVHSMNSGVMSLTPLGSTARTWKTWLPTDRFSSVSGLLHSVKSAPSSEHSKSKTNVPSGSSPMNSKIAVVAVGSATRSRPLEVPGAVRLTTLQGPIAGGGSTWPTSSIARTSKTCLPGLNTSTSYGTPG